MDLRSLRYFVAVAEERHFGRAATRLHMTQPPLSRAIKQLENDLGTALLHRSSTGVTLTAAGTALLDEALTILAQSEQARARVAAAAGTATLTVGTLADSAEQVSARIASAFRKKHPAVHIRIHEADLTEPTAGLRAGIVDVALTRAPFDDTGIGIHVLRTDPVGVVLATDDPLTRRDQLSVHDLADRRWFRFPDGTDPVWQTYWNGGATVGERHDEPVVRTAQECMQAVLWNGTVGLIPLPHALPEGLTYVPLTDQPPSQLVVAWNSTNTSPLIRSFIQIAAAVTRSDNEVSSEISVRSRRQSKH